jgi:hypothetical protein
MATLAGTIETYDISNAGQSHDPMREDLSDIIYNISPTETPFMMMIGRGTANQTRHEWNTDRLMTVDENNAHLEGDDVATFPETVQSYRIDNICQISRKLVIVAGTTEVVDKAGRKSELAYQLAKRAKELKRDMETILIAGRTAIGTNPQGKAIASSGAARFLAPYETWMTDGSNNATPTADWVGSEQPQNITGTATATTDGFQPTDGAQRVDGVVRAFAEADLKDVIKQCWDQGGDATVIMTGSFNKQAASAFSGNTTRFDRSEDMRLVTAVDIYVSDFGEHRIVPNRFSRERSVLVITPSMWSVDYLRGFRQFPLAKTGDAEKRELLVEYTLRASNPHASGIVADLTAA